MQQAIERLRAWQSEHKKGLFDLAVIFVLALVALVLAQRLSMGRLLIEWTRESRGLTPVDFLIPAGVLSIALPIFALRRFRELRWEIARANTDHLTGLLNRRRFTELLEQEVARAVRHHRPLSLVMLDVDRLKDINDKLGHHVGDSVLKAVAAVGARLIRRTDHLARWGGDEFMIIAPETESAGAQQMAEKIRRAVEDNLFTTLGHLTVSIGLTDLASGDNGESLTRRADRLLLQAKQDGGNRVSVG